MAETWVLNATITRPSYTLIATFTTNGESCVQISSARITSSGYVLAYGFKSGELAENKAVYYSSEGWVNDAYRTLVFDAAPTGGFLTWLQANGVKQGGSDPEPETPANVCLVDGTVYGITTGQTLVDGTAQTIYNGRTLVGGTGYDIVLSQSGFTVTVTGSGEEDVGWTKMEYAAVVINGTAYTSAATVEVGSGTLITLRTNASNNSSQANTRIIVDGVTVARGTTAAAASYTYTPTDDITVTLSFTLATKGNYGIITVTTS